MVYEGLMALAIVIVVLLVLEKKNGLAPCWYWFFYVQFEINDLGEELTKETVLSHFVGENYETKASTIENHQLKESPVNAKGTYTE